MINYWNDWTGLERLRQLVCLVSLVRLKGCNIPRSLYQHLSPNYFYKDGGTLVLCDVLSTV